MAAMKRLLCCCVGGGNITDLKRVSRPTVTAVKTAQTQEFSKGEWQDHDGKKGKSGKVSADVDIQEPDVVTSHKTDDGQVATSLPSLAEELAEEGAECESLPDIQEADDADLQTDIPVDDALKTPVEEVVVQSKAVKEVHTSFEPPEDNTDLKPSEEIEITLSDVSSSPSRSVATAGLTLSVDRAKQRHSLPVDALSVSSREESIVSPTRKKGGKSGRSLFLIKRSSSPNPDVTSPGVAVDKVLLVESKKAEASGGSDEEK